MQLSIPGTVNAVSIYMCHSGGVQVKSWQRQLITDLNHNLNETIIVVIT